MPRPTHRGQPTTLLTAIPTQNKSAPELPLGHFFLLSPRTTTFQFNRAYLIYVWGLVYHGGQPPEA